MSEKRCSFVAVVGQPNAGKSTLVNTVVGEKVSIVSHKIQTTRMQVRGIAAIGRNSQVVFIDTPGFCQSRTPLESVIAGNFKSSLNGVDLALVLIDASAKYDESSLSILQLLQQKKINTVVVINKVDIAKKENILRVASALAGHTFLKKVFMISALTGDGIEDLKEFLAEDAPIGPWMYAPGQATDMTTTLRLAEITREKIFERMEKEIPYSIYVETELFKETEKKARIYQSIVVMKDSQKGIILGRNGLMIKEIKEASIADMRNLLGKKIELRLFVKVRTKWATSRIHLQNAGIID
ncbi:MAG: GTPase Era [Holosporales bacterium]|jgi:GTP-binding protein Era|nr:GTPase Era [Holosporales bacterium]